MDLSNPIFAIIGVIALGVLAGGAIVVIDALIIRKIRRPGPPKDEVSDRP